MPLFFQKLTNAALQSEAFGEFDTAEQAFDDAVSAAMSIATDEILKGSASAVVQIEICSPKVVRVLHGAVSINIARLLNNPVKEPDNDID